MKKIILLALILLSLSSMAEVLSPEAEGLLAKNETIEVVIDPAVQKLEFVTSYHYTENIRVNGFKVLDVNNCSFSDDKRRMSNAYLTAQSMGKLLWIKFEHVYREYENGDVFENCYKKVTLKIFPGPKRKTCDCSSGE